MMIEGDLSFGDEHTVQYTDDVSQNFTLEACIILLTNITPINVIKFKEKFWRMCFTKMRVKTKKIENWAPKHRKSNA